MKTLARIMVMALTIVVASCASDNEWEDNWWQQNGTNPMDGAASNVSASIGELTSFTIAVDSTALSETETIPTDDEDYVENNSFGSTISITYSGNTATVSGSVEGVTVTTSGAHVTINSTVKGVNYTLSGTTSNGSFKIYGEKKFQLTLAGVDITNPTGAAINSQCKKRAYVVVKDGTFNRLADGTTYVFMDDEDMKATFFSEGELLFSGKGRLRVYANYKNGITSDDYILVRPGSNIYVSSTAGNAIKANDAVVVRGGVINVETTATAGKGIKSDGYVAIEGGRVTAITTGGGEWDSDDNDVKGAAGIKADSIITINGGDLRLFSSGQGGKGMSGDQTITINDGSVKVITTGAQYVYNRYDTKAKGIKSDGDLTINGGTVAVRTTGGDGSEGLESKSKLTINGGSVESYAYDDAINSVGALVIAGGNVFAYSSSNDGIDSNSTLTIKGGNVIACGTTQPEDGFDCDQNTFTITGGNVVGIGGGTSTPSSSGTQPIIIAGGSNISANTYITLAGSSDANIFAFKVPRAYNSYTLLVSSSSLTKGGKCTIATGATVSGGNDFDGFITGATVNGGTTLYSGTLSNIVTTSNYSSGMGGMGGMPGPGGWH